MQHLQKDLQEEELLEKLLEEEQLERRQEEELLEKLLEEEQLQEGEDNLFLTFYFYIKQNYPRCSPIFTVPKNTFPVVVLMLI